MYASRAGDSDHSDNRALRAAHQLRVPIVYYVATRPGYYRPIYPAYIVQDDPATQHVLAASRPMLELLKQFHTRPIVVPSRVALRPDRERLAERFERFDLAT